MDGRRPLTAPHACVLICLVWAGIYLPGLGSVPLKHEEPRRALPAVHMLATGDWLVPRVGGVPYLRKPPLLNWLIALSIRATGTRSEFAVRLPSVLAMLALALTIVTAGRRWLGGPGALLAAIFTLTNLAAMETGRLAELEALYLSVTGIALILWLTAWQANANAWRLWCAPAPFLALGMLTKGPAHLLFFYGIAVAVLAVGKEWKRLLHPAHGVALAITFVPVAAWAIPCAQAVGTADPSLGTSGAWAFWWREISSRAVVTEAGHFALGRWLLRVPQGFINYLPWTVLLPLLWLPGLPEHFTRVGPREGALFRGARWGMVTTFLVMSLLPGGSARYVYPLFVVPGVLLARVLTLGKKVDGLGLFPSALPAIWRTTNNALYAVLIVAAVALPFVALPEARTGWAVAQAGGLVLIAIVLGLGRVSDGGRILPVALQSAAGMVLITAVYTLAAVPRMNLPRAGLPREVAASIRAHVPDGKTLAVFDDGYHPFWYYLEPAVIYFRPLAAAPHAGGIDYFVLPVDSQGECIAEAARRGVVLHEIGEATDGEHHPFVLLARQTDVPTMPPRDLLPPNEFPRVESAR